MGARSQARKVSYMYIDMYVPNVVRDLLMEQNHTDQQGKRLGDTNAGL